MHLEGLGEAANVNGKRGHFMLQCMASGQSGNDHAQAPPKVESLRVPVFWHHIPETWVSFYYPSLHAHDVFLTRASLNVKFIATNKPLGGHLGCPLTSDLSTM